VASERGYVDIVTLLLEKGAASDVALSIAAPFSSNKVTISTEPSQEAR
jgi:hypothetical protein